MRQASAPSAMGHSAAAPEPTGGEKKKEESAPAAKKLCFKCNQPGHFANACPNGKAEKVAAIEEVEEPQDLNDQDTQ